MPYQFENREVFGLGERDSGFKARSINGFHDFKKVQEKCITSATIFEDDEFPATDASIGVIEGCGPYTWKRPHEIVRGKKPDFIIQGAERFDVIQGDLGNCWLLAAVADLTLNKEIFHIVVPEDNTFGRNYTGAFHFRFWQFGKWIDVVIDDRLPCRSNGKLAFMNSITRNEFWSPLLEKAYAKLNGSYQALDGGLTFEALEDFTGGFTEVVLIERLKSTQILDAKTELYTILRKSFERASFMGSSVKLNPQVIEDELPNGLIRGHAYSITDIRLVNVNINGNIKQVELVRLRNPWGTDAEWKGDWCDRSLTWANVSEQELKSIQHTVSADGEFWMSYEDFFENFERIEACHTNPHSKEELIGDGIDRTKTWVNHSIPGNWILGVTAGGSRRYKETFANNPQYIMTIGKPGDTEDNTVIVCLLKRERKAEPELPDVENLSFNVFPLRQNAPVPLTTDYLYNKDNAPLEQSKSLTGVREITVRFLIPSGTYCIVPTSIKPNQEGEFLLRVFTEGESTLKLYDQAVKIIDTEIDVKDDSAEEKAKLIRARTFFKMVSGDHPEVNWWDLKLILDKSFHDEFRFEGFGFSEDICRSMVALMDEDRSGQLNFFEFTNLWGQIVMWKKIFNEHDENQSNTLGSLKTNELRSALNAGGYIVNKDILETIVLRYGDKNGEISLDKFIVAALKLKTMITLYERRKLKADEDNAVMNLDQWLADTIYS